jgi:hypothetical protein
MVELDKQLDGLIDDQYVPSSVETKKAVLMYFFVGIVAALSKESVTPYEYFHLKQALWWWVIFFISIPFAILFVLTPWIWLLLLPFLVFLLYLVVWILFVKQAYEWRYVLDEDKIVLPLFAAIGWWMLSIFELEVKWTTDKKDWVSEEVIVDNKTWFEID